MQLETGLTAQLQAASTAQAEPTDSKKPQADHLEAASAAGEDMEIEDDEAEAARLKAEEEEAAEAARLKAEEEEAAEAARLKAEEEDAAEAARLKAEEEEEEEAAKQAAEAARLKVEEEEAAEVARLKAEEEEEAAKPAAEDEEGMRQRTSRGAEPLLLPSDTTTSADHDSNKESKEKNNRMCPCCTIL